MKKIFMLLSLFFLLLFSGEVLAEGIDSYTTLMLHFNESDASFADSSPQNNTLTNNGVAYTSAGKYSGAGVFNGYDMSIPYNAALNPGTGDFSIDAQVKFTSLDSYYNTLIGQAGTGAMIVHLFSDGTLKLGVSNMGYQSQCSLSTSTLTDGNYHHLEISRTSGVVYMFLDGQSQTVSGSGNTTNYVFLSALNVITVGSQNGVNLWSTGNIDELRFQTGQGGHTANFIPPSAPWGYGINSNTKLMLHFNESDATFADSSPLANTVTNSGVAYTSSGKFSGAGVFSGGYLSVPYSTALNAGTGDFSIDARINFTSLNTGTLIGQSPSGGMVIHLFSNGALCLGIGDGGYQSQCSLSASTITDGNYHHLEISRTNGVVYMFLDGQSQTVTGTNNTTSYNFLSGYTVTIGSQHGRNLWSAGNIDELRYQTGEGGHTASFTPSAVRYSAASVPGIDSYTKLMLHADGTGSTFADSSSSQRTVTAGGDATQSNTGYKFGGRSAYFDGSGDYLSAASSQDFSFGADDFTVDAWVYVTDAREILLFDNRTGASDSGFGCRIGSDLKLYYSNSANNALTSTAVPLNTWTHVAWVRHSGVLTGYINGVSGGYVTYTGDVTHNNCYIGRVGFADSGYMAGYIDELRVSTGIARWTADFTVPDAPYGEDYSAGGSGGSSEEQTVQQLQYFRVIEF